MRPHSKGHPSWRSQQSTAWSTVSRIANQGLIFHPFDIRISPERDHVEEEETTYRLDYKTMSKRLQRLRYWGIVSSFVPASTALGQSGYILLMLEDGAVMSCVILNEHGRRLHFGVNASHLFPRLDGLEWTLTSLLQE
jgi:hypothetical protein